MRLCELTSSNMIVFMEERVNRYIAKLLDDIRVRCRGLPAMRAPRVRALRRTHTGRHSRVAAPRPLPSPQEFMRMLLPRDLKLRISTTA